MRKADLKITLKKGDYSGANTKKLHHEDISCMNDMWMVYHVANPMWCTKCTPLKQEAVGLPQHQVRYMLLPLPQQPSLLISQFKS